MRLTYLKYILCVSCLSFALTSCEYTPEPLPQKLTGDYELAIPIADTLLSFRDMIESRLGHDLPDTLTIPAGTQITFERDFPFYVGEFNSEGSRIHWLEPKSIITSDFFEKITPTISFYILSPQGTYTLMENKVLGQGYNALMGNAAARLDPAKLTFLKEECRLYIKHTVTVNEDITFANVKENRTHVGFGIRISLQLNVDL